MFLTKAKTGLFVLKKANGKREKWRETHDHVVFWPFAFAVNVMLNNREIKVAEHSFLAPMHYLSLFSLKPLAVGSQNWQGASSTKKVCILICFIVLGTVTMATQLEVNQH